eukprot:scaffold226277_cov36-Prasinocladus_malaysianus.AAC.1
MRSMAIDNKALEVYTLTFFFSGGGAAIRMTSSKLPSMHLFRIISSMLSAASSESSGAPFTPVCQQGQQAISHPAQLLVKK